MRWDQLSCRVVTLFSLMFALVAYVGAQAVDNASDQGKSVEVTVHLLAKNGTAPLPSSLNAVAKKIRSEIGDGDPKLLDVSRVLGGYPGGVTYEGSLPASVATDPRLDLLDWSLNFTGTSSRSPGRFLTGLLRVAFIVNIPTGVDSSGKVLRQQKQFVLGGTKPTFADGVPTLVGPATVPSPNERVFVIVTVRSADR